MSRGGNRPPDNPAPVSGPGALSRRTDGGPGSGRQPIRVATGGSYGSAKASEQQQQGAPLPVAPNSQVGSMAGEAPMPPPSTPAQGVFGPSLRPTENPLAGTVQGPSGVGPDPDALLRAVYAVLPHPQILNLIRRN